MPFKRGKTNYFQVLINFGAVIYNFQSFAVKGGALVDTQPLTIHIREYTAKGFAYHFFKRNTLNFCECLVAIAKNPINRLSFLVEYHLNVRERYRHCVKELIMLVISNILYQKQVFISRLFYKKATTILLTAPWRLVYFTCYSSLELFSVVWLCLPCPPKAQTLKWSAPQVAEYREILGLADDVRILSQTYTQSCMLDRNRYMVDNSSTLIHYLRSNRGGTSYTVSYAQKQNIQIIGI